MARIRNGRVRVVLQNILLCMGTLVDVCWFCVDTVCGRVVSVGSKNVGITLEMQYNIPQENGVGDITKQWATPSH
jgi:hypothetical protein